MSPVVTKEEGAMTDILEDSIRCNGCLREMFNQASADCGKTSQEIYAGFITLLEKAGWVRGYSQHWVLCPECQDRFFPSLAEVVRQRREKLVGSFG